MISGLDREVNDFLVVQLQAVDDGTNPGPQTGYASVSQLAPNISYISIDLQRHNSYLQATFNSECLGQKSLHHLCDFYARK